MREDVIAARLARAVTDGAAPGLSAAVRGADGQVRTFTAGTRGAADPAPVQPNTVFWIASCTKAVVSAAAAELVAQGRLDLDAPVADLVPHFGETQVLAGFDADGAPQLRKAARPITLRHLLTHSSGLAYDFNSPETLRYLGARNLNLYTAGAHGFPLVFEPGEGWVYGVGIDAAGQVVEAAAGVSLGEHLERTIFAPLGMAHTTFDPTPAHNANRAGLHARLPDGGVAPMDPIPPMPPALRGGGGLVSTPSDYLRFLGAVMDPASPVFSAATRAHLTTPLVTGDHVGAIKSTLPPISHDFTPLPGRQKGWTLGFLQNLDDVPAGRRAGSLTWAGIANCYYWADPASGVAGALFAQVLPFADPRILEVFEAVEQAAYAE